MTKTGFGLLEAEHPYVLGHLPRPGRAVHADDVDVIRLERDQGAPISVPSRIVPMVSTVTETMTGSRLRRFFEVLEDPTEGRLCLEHVLAGLDAEEIDPPFDKSARLLL